MIVEPAAGRPEVLNAYPRAVREAGNPRAREAMGWLLEPSSELWRGLGRVPGASLSLRPEHLGMDARARFGLPELEDRDPPGCRCAEVIRGKIEPAECGLFARRCTPERPVGPCMVSAEGTCAAHFRYGQEQ